MVWHLWANEYHKLLGCFVVTKGLAQNHGSSSIVIIGGQCHKSLVCRGKISRMRTDNDDHHFISDEYCYLSWLTVYHQLAEFESLYSSLFISYPPIFLQIQKRKKKKKKHKRYFLPTFFPTTHLNCCRKFYLNCTGVK